MNLIEIVQAASAIYILVVLAYAIVSVVQASWDRGKSNFNFNGWPAFALLIATIICAITTLQVTP